MSVSHRSPKQLKSLVPTRYIHNFNEFSWIIFLYKKVLGYISEPAVGIVFCDVS